MVQLAFHDAGTYDKTDRSGGPDGCVNLDLAENKGLKGFIVPLLAPVYGARLLARTSADTAPLIPYFPTSSALSASMRVSGALQQRTKP
jgi:hypothetical protein